MKVEAILWPRINKNQKYFIKIRKTENRKSITYINTGYSISKRYWNEKTHRVRTSHRNHEEINEHIEFEISRINIESSTITIIKDNEKIKYENISYLDYLNKQLNYIEERGRFSDYRKHKVIRKHLLNYVKEKYNNKDVLFKHITIDFLEGFISYFNKPERKHNNNTIKQSIAKLRFFYNKALKDNIYKVKDNPFNHITIKATPTDNKGLKMEEFILLDNISPFGFMTLLPIYNHKEIFYTKNYFMLQIFASGIRVSDLLMLKWSNINNGYLEYEMRKTNKPMKIPINNKLIEVLRFFLPYVYKKIILEKYPDDIELYLSMSNTEKELFNKTNPNLIVDPKIDKPIYYYQSNNHSHILRMINGCRNSHGNNFIINIFTNRDIERLNSKSLDINNITHRIIQSNTTKYNKRLKVLHSLIIGGNMKIETKLTTHVSRHTYASLMISTSANLTAVSKTLGHSSISTTENYLKSIANSFIYEEVSKSFDALQKKSIEKNKEFQEITYVKRDDLLKKSSKINHKNTITILIGTIFIKNGKTMILYPSGKTGLISIVSISSKDLVEGKLIGSIIKENGFGYLVKPNGDKNPFKSKVLNLPPHVIK